MSSETILVVGGTGMLGRRVTRRLLQDGFIVRLLTRDPERARGDGEAPDHELCSPPAGVLGEPLVRFSRLLSVLASGAGKFTRATASKDHSCSRGRPNTPSSFLTVVKGVDSESAVSAALCDGAGITRRH